MSLVSFSIVCSECVRDDPSAQPFASIAYFTRNSSCEDVQVLRPLPGEKEGKEEQYGRFVIVRDCCLALLNGVSTVASDAMKMESNEEAKTVQQRFDDEQEEQEMDSKVSWYSFT